MNHKVPDDGAEVAEAPRPGEQQDGPAHGVDGHADAGVRGDEVAAGAGAGVDADVLGVHEDEDEREGVAELEMEE